MEVNLAYPDASAGGAPLPPDVSIFSPREREVLDLVNRKVAAAESLEDILGFLLAATGDVCPCDRISLAFLEDDGRRLVSHCTQARYQPLLLKKGYAGDVDRSSLARVIAEGRPRVIADLPAYLTEHPDSPSSRLLVKEGVQSSMTCPLLVDGRVVGVMFRSARRPRAYDAGQVRLHRALAERLSQAVEKALRIERLEEARRAYGEMLGFVAHELKSPVASMAMDLHVLEDGHFGPVTAAQRQRMQRMRGKCDYLLGLVGEYLNLARLEGGELEPDIRESVPMVGEVLEPALEVVASQVEAKRMTVHRDLPDPEPTADCDPALMRIVFVNLLGNAAKYGREGGAIRVSAATVDGQVVLAVRNDGAGFPPQEKARLFRRFSRLRVPEHRGVKGTGVGLYTCWRIVKAHGGRIDAESEYGEWAEFRLRIPRNVKREG